MIGSQAEAEQTRIVLLGTGTPNPDPFRSGPAVAIVTGDESYLVDFGPGVVRRAAAAFQNGIAALKPANLKRAFLTHLHSDHTAGYPDLILTPWVVGRKAPLEVYGPKGTLDMTNHILDAYAADIQERRLGREKADPQGCQVRVHEIDTPGLIYHDDRINVEAFHVRHGSWPAFGYKFTTSDLTVVVSGDTAPNDNIRRMSMGCDVLIHEVYALAAFSARPAAWQQYHSKVHTSSQELGELAAQTNPGLLVLYHQLLWGTSETELLHEIRDRFDGPMVSGKDLQVYP
jgi:ribonuclease BN (tRNA processing enzyme)